MKLNKYEIGTIILTTVIYLVSLLLINVHFNQQATNLKKQLTRAGNQYETQQACDRSLRDASYIKTCGDLQTKYNIEFVCTSLQANASCGAELK